MSLKLNHPSKIREIQGQDIKEGSNPHLAFIANTTFEGSVTRLGDLLDFGQIFKAFGQQLIYPNLLHS